MPPSGRKPKPAGQAINRNKPVHDWTEVVDVPFEGGPDLPEMRADGRRWPDRTREKWDAWRSMPHCKLWGPAEWNFALDTIELAATFHDTGESKYATELRNRERILGTTGDFLRDLRIRYVAPKDRVAEAAGVTNLADYRDL